MLLANLLIQRRMDLAWPFAQLHPRAIADNRRQPSGHLRLSPELLFVLIAGVGGYLWIVTTRIQTAIQPDQMHAAISAAQDQNQKRSQKAVQKPNQNSQKSEQATEHHTKRGTPKPQPKATTPPPSTDQ